MADNIKALIRERTTIKSQVTRLQTYLNTHEIDIDEVGIRKDKLEELNKEFSRIQLAIDIAQDKEDEDPSRLAFENQYYECARILAKRLRELTSNVSSPAPSISSIQSPANVISNVHKPQHALLPKIEIRPFDGNPIEWHSFYDTFRSVVHENEDLPAVQKFHLLKNALRGEVTTVITGFNATEHNYFIAWEALQKRCNRPRQIVQAHLKSLLELGEITRETPSSLRTLAERAEMHVNALHALEQPTDTWDAILVYIISKKLDKNTRRLWQRSLDDQEMPKFKSLIDFIIKQSRGDELETTNSGEIKHTVQLERQTRNRQTNRVQQSYIGTQPPCAICKQGHAIFTCPSLLSLTPRDRADKVRRANLCLNCLRGNHATAKCMSSGCRHCNKRHNTLLHFSNENSHNASKVTNSMVTNITSEAARAGPSSLGHNENGNNNPVVVSKNSYLSASLDSEVLLGTARVIILDRHNQEHECRVLLDSGSQTHFITERLADQLDLPRNNTNISFAGLGQRLTDTKHTVKTTIRSRTSPFESELTFVLLPNITGLLPARQINRGSIMIPRNVKLADPDFHKSAGVDALIGNTLFYHLLCVGQIKPCNDAVVLQKTRLGWIVTGEVDFRNQATTSNIRRSHIVTTLDNQLQQFWEIEQVPDKKHFSAEESKCEEHFTKHTRRDSTGRYIVSLPFKDSKEQLGDSYRTALKRFYALERRLARNPEAFQQYSNFLSEYLTLGHMTEITHTDNKESGCYLPHHAVIKESSLTTKTRVVFDGSALTSSQVALNDVLMVGPTIQDDLISIIMRFRTHRYVLTADIEKMFRQIRVEDRDAEYQKILWRDDKNDALKTFRLNTVTYGTACAPFLAVRTLKQLAIDEGRNFPLGATTLTNDFYVDDMLTGANTFENAIALKNQITQLLKLGGFNLRQWSSNEARLISEMTDSINSSLLPLDGAGTKRVLGVHWNSGNDTIHYSITPLVTAERITKRLILSHIAQLFDPLGLLGPVVVKAKILMQHLWKENLTWDETVPPHIHSSWSKFRSTLPVLNNFNVTRRIMLDEPISIELHGFADASEAAYGACIYVRSTNQERKHAVHLVCAKSRVAPIKSVSLPRLELCAATLLATLYKASIKALNIQFNKVKFWTDSTIVLSWIQSSPHILKTFVANRVSEIHTHTRAEDWGHVSSQDNPADYISRGQTPTEFVNNQHWLNGPIWLSNEETDWPELPALIYDVPEQRIKVALLVQREQREFLTRFSSIIALNRFVAYCLRFLYNHKNTIRLKGELTAQEIQQAHIRIIKLVQEETFAETLDSLKSNKPLHKKDKLLSLTPFLDNNAILRVGGRLGNAHISYTRKHPMLLPKSHHVTTLIIRHEHERHWHAGVQATLNAIRQKYWLVDGKNTIRRVLHNCIRCRKSKPIIPNYIMGNLPEGRVTVARPFENVGIDYCGPFFIKEKKLRNRNKIKAYVAIFVCFCTKSVHLELVTDLTTEACLAAIKRFFGRRGKSRNIYSDNGTNFIGANNELREILKHQFSERNNKAIKHALADEGVNWHFSPPRSPHFGGLWEAAVKSFKKHLHIVVGQNLFTYEQFNTFIIEIEAILNSRPITPLSSDPNDLSALTPGHFLIGDTLKSIPEHDFREEKTNRLSAYQHLQTVKQHFWSRWQGEYLNQLHTRSKWHLQDTAEIKVGTLVTIKEDHQPPLHWSMGRIIATHPGNDGIVRVATVKTAKGTYKRSVKLLCPLPIETTETID